MVVRINARVPLSTCRVVAEEWQQVCDSGRPPFGSGGAKRLKSLHVPSQMFCTKESSCAGGGGGPCCFHWPFR